jgi:hypothetical protein
MWRWAGFFFFFFEDTVNEGEVAIVFAADR